MKTKQGISLIVLVITIIVMIILASSVIITLSNSGIIGKATDAVTEYNLKQMQTMAQTACADMLIEGEEVTDTEVLKRMGIVEAKDVAEFNKQYDIKLSGNCVTITLKSSGSSSEEEQPEITIVNGKSVEQGGEWIFDAATGTIKGMVTPYGRTAGYNYSSSDELYKSQIYPAAANYNFDESTGVLTIPNYIDGVEVKKLALGDWGFYDWENNISADTHGAFYYLMKEKGLKEIVVSNGITEIKDFGYSDNVNWYYVFGDLKITLPNTLKTIGDWAFSQMYLKSIVIPKSVEYIGENPFVSGLLVNFTNIYFEGSKTQAANFDPKWNYYRYDDMGWPNPSPEGELETVYNYAG